MAAASSGGATRFGEAASRKPMPGTTRPVPNRLFMLSAQATALPLRSMVTKLVEAGSTGNAPAGTSVCRSAMKSPPLARQADATAMALALAASSAAGAGRHRLEGGEAGHA